jgi:hypothetical protein
MNKLEQLVNGEVPTVTEPKDMTTSKRAYVRRGSEFEEHDRQIIEEERRFKEARAIETERQRRKDRELVKGIFRFHEVPGGQMGFNFRKYKGDQVEKFEMNDGEVYTVPLGVAKHLNTNCWYPTYTFKNDEAGRPSMSVGEKVRRCSFQSLEFIDLEGVDSKPNR